MLVIGAMVDDPDDDRPSGTQLLGVEANEFGGRAFDLNRLYAGIEFADEAG
jgi:hypothetical protein